MFDYDIMAKRDMDKVVRQAVVKFEELGQTPTKIAMSPKMYTMVEGIFPIRHKHMLEFDGIPVIKDETLDGEKIVIQ